MNLLMGASHVKVSRKEKRIERDISRHLQRLKSSAFTQVPISELLAFLQKLH